MEYEVTRGRNLKTMRANPDFSIIPAGCISALIQYDQLRDKFGPTFADYEYSKTQTSERLVNGLKAQTTRGLIIMGGKYANICANYVRGHVGDLKTMMGLFYWNGSDELTTRIILNAWKRNL